MSKISTINTCINQAIAKTKTHAKRNLQEPDYTAAFTLFLPKLLQDNNIMPSVRFGGCFIHQRPKVTFKSSVYGGINHSCELGDVLLLGRKKVNGKDRFNAMLIQIKRHEKDIVSIVSNGEMAQLELYVKWPTFTMNTTSNQYDIQPKTVNMGAQYANVKEDNHIYIDTYVHIPERLMKFTSDYTLARTLWNFMNWETGRTINTQVEKSNEEWSKLIWDLIESTQNKFFTRRNISTTPLNRTSNHFFELMTNSKINLIEEHCFLCDGYDNCQGVSNTEENDENNGISILFVDLGEQLIDE